MSLCLILQTEQIIAIGADSRISESLVASDDAQAYWISDDAKKLHIVNDKIIFTAGQKLICDLIIDEFKKSEDQSIESLQLIMKETGKQFKSKFPFLVEKNPSGFLEFCIATIENGKPTFYSINNKKDYQILKNIAPPGQTSIITSGVYTKKAQELASLNFGHMDVFQLYAFVYSSLADEKVGGILTLHILDKDKGIYLSDTFKIPDSKPLKRFDDYKHLFPCYVLGNELRIQNQAGDLSIDQNGISVTKMNLQMISNNNKSRININPTSGIQIQKNTGTTSNPVWSNQISLDSDGNAVFGGNITIGSGNSVFKADSNGIYLGHNTFSSAPFRVDILGNLRATSAIFTNSSFNNGEIIGSSINIGNGAFTVNSAGAVVASNITINGGSINWSNVNSDPVATNASNIATAALVSATSIANGTYSGGTFINNRIIYSPTIMTGTSGRYLKLEGSELLSMNGNTEDGISLDGSTGMIKFFNNGRDSGEIFFHRSDFGPVIGLSHENRVVIFADNGIDIFGISNNHHATINIGTSRMVGGNLVHDQIIARGIWNFSNATVTGLDVYARFA